jgi:hypothetical protein
MKRLIGKIFLTPRWRSMLRLARRFLVIAALVFWQGGFTFYAAVVVPIGAEVLESHTKQGFITRQVSNWLNVAGAAGLLLLAWDMAVCRDAVRWRGGLRWAAWSVALLTLGALAVLHLRLDELLEPEQMRILEREQYRDLHRIYLWTSTIQWAAIVVWLLVTLSAWRAEDGGAT